MQPKLSARKVADLKKAAAFHGFEWPLPTKTQQHPRPGKLHGFIKPLRGVKGARPEVQRKRLQEIADKLKGSLARVEKHRQQERDRKWVDHEDPLHFGKEGKSGKSGKPGKPGSQSKKSGTPAKKKPKKE